MNIIVPIQQQMRAFCVKTYIIHTYELSYMLRR